MKALIALFAAALVTTAVADDQYSKDNKSTKSPEAKFEALDKNGDAQLSKAEVRDESALSAQFASIDVNADGFVSKTEYAAKVSMKKEPH